MPDRTTYLKISIKSNILMRSNDWFFLQLLQNKFNDLKHRVDTGAERLNQCNEFAKKLLASESPYIADIEKSQDQLRFVYFLRQIIYI